MSLTDELIDSILDAAYRKATESGEWNGGMVGQRWNHIAARAIFAHTRPTLAREALRRAERKLTAYVGAFSGDKELTNAVLPMVRAALDEASPPTEEPVLRDVAAERQRQDEKWGGAAHDDEHSVNDFVQLINDYAGWARAMAGMDSMDKARRRLVQVAALAVAACEAIDRAAARRST